MSPEVVKILGDVAVALSPVLLAAIGYLSVRLAGFIKSKTDSAALQAILLKLNSAVWTVIGEMDQTLVEEFKLASADGKLTKAEKERILSIAMQKLKGYVSFDELGRLLGLLDAPSAEKYVRSKVEAAVGEKRVIDNVKKLQSL